MRILYPHQQLFTFKCKYTHIQQTKLYLLSSKETRLSSDLWKMVLKSAFALGYGPNRIFHKGSYTYAHIGVRVYMSFKLCFLFSFLRYIFIKYNHLLILHQATCSNLSSIAGIVFLGLVMLIFMTSISWIWILLSFVVNC